jgi:hypothetical protein
MTDQMSRVRLRRADADAVIDKTTGLSEDPVAWVVASVEGTPSVYAYDDQPEQTIELWRNLRKFFYEPNVL